MVLGSGHCYGGHSFDLMLGPVVAFKIVVSVVSGCQLSLEGKRKNMDHLTMWDLIKKRDLLRGDIRFDANNRIARLSTNISWALEYDLLMVKINELRAIDHKITAAWKEQEKERNVQDKPLEN